MVAARAVVGLYDGLMTESDGIEVRRLGPDDRQLARAVFHLMANVFGERPTQLSDAYLEVLLSQPDFWAIAAIDSGTPAGGLTAHTLPMTAYQGAEEFSLRHCCCSPSAAARLRTTIDRCPSD